MRAMIEALRHVLREDPGVTYALVFGSSARGTAGPHSDLDVTVGLAAGVRLTTLELGALASKLEDAAGKP
jgi:predicted nucleotidyltransferase